MVEALVLRHVTDKNVGPRYSVALLQVDAKAFPIESPAERVDAKIYILAVDEGKVIRYFPIVYFRQPAEDRGKFAYRQGARVGRIKQGYGSEFQLYFKKFSSNFLAQV
jgi:hypothetical protein